MAQHKSIHYSSVDTPGEKICEPILGFTNQVWLCQGLAEVPEVKCSMISSIFDQQRHSLWSRFLSCVSLSLLPYTLLQAKELFQAWNALSQLHLSLSDSENNR